MAIRQPGVDKEREKMTVVKTSRPAPGVFMIELSDPPANTYTHQMFRQMIQRQHGRICQIGNVVDAGEVRDDGAPAHIDENARRGQQLLADANRVRTFKSGMAFDNGAAVHSTQIFFLPCARIENNLVGARLHLFHVHPNRAFQHDAEVRGAARQMNSVGAGNQRFRRHASGVDAGSAKQFSFDEGDGHSGELQPAHSLAIDHPGEDRAERHGELAGDGRRPGVHASEAAEDQPEVQPAQDDADPNR